MIETNLLGAITTTEVFLDQLIADGGGDSRPRSVSLNEILVRPTGQAL